MLARGTLGSFPPVTAADYGIYAWPNGITPVISSLYFWTYAVAGAAPPAAAAPVIWLQVGLIAACVHALAQSRFSPRAGARTLPLWSPEVPCLFDPTVPPPEIARRLRAADIGYVLLHTGRGNERFLARSAFFRDPA
jgi:hypothetical protein